MNLCTFQGILMVKHNNEWGTVCDDDFTSTSAEAACHTLGLRYTTFSYREAVTGNKAEEDKSRIWMDDVHCSSRTTNFLECSQHGWGSLRDCTGHWEDIVLTCN